MPKKFPLFIDLTEKKVVVYGAGVIASRRVETLLAFTSSLTVFAPEASEPVQVTVEQSTKPNPERMQREAHSGQCVQ